MTFGKVVTRLLCILSLLCFQSAFASLVKAQDVAATDIPLPEHPRPDFQRSDWINLNGTWQFRFDPEDVGQRERWFEGNEAFPLSILVPFPWGSPLSGVSNDADVAWYARTIETPPDWNGRRVFLVIGASDWLTTAWLDGQELGTHQGGYTPFEFEITPYLKPGQTQRLVIRVDDTEHDFKLEGKQGYGAAKGIWQTPYLEVRGDVPLAYVHFTPDIDQGKVTVEARLHEAAPSDLPFRLEFLNQESTRPPVTQQVPAGADRITFDVSLPDARLWSLDDPYLYEVRATLGEGERADVVDTYFGMRKISVVDLPGTSYRYVALNDEPIYLQLALDQAYHPEGFYTFPSDEFMRDEILRSRRIGLNGMRVHVKIEHPRKLYWADRLGMLIMADVPNSWGEPTPEMRQEIEYALTNMIRRDYNHPSIFSWVPFNETWGLTTREGNRNVYRKDTQEWVVSVYRLAKELDPTRLVEDNSVCCGRGHTETDLNSWHAYLPGYQWEDHLSEISDSTFPGSTWNFEDGFQQADQPNINSEFGNVWGYEGSTGDVDWSWDYHRAVNAFRRHPAIAGWLYTEHHDVINEWNGYWRYDRSEKETGLGELVEGMTLNDLHSPLYIAVGHPTELSREVSPGETVEVPLWASFMTGSTAYGNELQLKATLYGWNVLGEKKTYFTTSRPIAFRPYLSEALAPLQFEAPDENAVAVLAVTLEDATGNVLHRNFQTFVVRGEAPERVTLATGKTARLLRTEAARFTDSQWSVKQWDVLDGLKVNGAGSGYFEYRFDWPEDLRPENVESASFLVEASAKQLFGKDRDDAAEMRGDYMRGEGTIDPSRNPNAYPMTDETSYPSAVSVVVNGIAVGVRDLADDPADHRGILSWHSQPQDGKLREAGSYGELVRVNIPADVLEKAATEGELVVRLEVSPALPGGLAIYGSRFGRYPVDPTIVITER